MPVNNRLRDKIETLLEAFRTRISYQDALPQLIGLGIVSGIFAALLVVLFRLQVEGSLALLFHGTAADFETLTPAWRFLMPFLGALLLGLALRSVDQRYHTIGVFHVLERLRDHQGRLPVKNLLVQFFGGSVALVSGQSIGREGPGVHLGAGIASLLGQWFELPNNALRTLIACGAAAAIAAAFNTPMAGVIFAMEVILMEYSIIGFIPVIIASVLGSTISQMVFGSDSLIHVPNVELNLLWELPFMVFGGLLFAIAALAFIRINLYAMRWRHIPVLYRYLFMGSLTGAVAVVLPQILGSGYDTLNLLFEGNIAPSLLIAIFVAKLTVTATVTGLGMVGGLIGPLLIIGGCLGGLLGVIGSGVVTEASSPAFYVALGMVAMLGAVLNAPLAALVTILELGNNPAIIFPSMLMVVVACVALQQLFHCQGVFAEQLRIEGVASQEAPARQFLSRVGVRSVMNTSQVTSPPVVSLQQAEELVRQAAVWIVIRHEQNGLQLISTADLVKHLESGREVPATPGADDPDGAAAQAATIDLTQIAARVYNATELDCRSNLYQASEAVREDGIDALCITRRFGPGRSVVGILTRDSLSKFYGI